MKALRLFAFPVLLAASLFGQGIPVQVIVTAESTKGHTPPELTAHDISLRTNQKAFEVEDLMPLRGEHADLQLAILIDDGLNTTLGLQFDDLRRFIRGQPPTTQIGVYYIRNGSAQPVQPITADHEAAARHLRLPLGEPGIAVSPYQAISELVREWPAATGRREILLISNGIDLYRGSPTQNPYLETAIQDCQRAHIPVHSIYFEAAGHAGHDFYFMNFGRDNLSYLGDETGGEAYWEGLATSVTLRPYFDDLNLRLQHQYLLTLRAEPQKKGRFENLRLRTELPQVELMTQDQVWVPAAK
jgi:hypothetical protein